MSGFELLILLSCMGIMLVGGAIAVRACFDQVLVKLEMIIMLLYNIEGYVSSCTLNEYAKEKHSGAKIYPYDGEQDGRV